jgi:hypothetical protein
LLRYARQLHVRELDRHRDVCAGALLDPDLVRAARHAEREQLAGLGDAALHAGLAAGLGLADLGPGLRAVEEACERLQRWDIVPGPPPGPVPAVVMSGRRAAELARGPRARRRTGELHHECARQLLERLHVPASAWRLRYGVEGLAALTPEQVEDLFAWLLPLDAQRAYLQERGRELEGACAELADVARAVERVGPAPPPGRALYGPATPAGPMQAAQPDGTPPSEADQTPPPAAERIQGQAPEAPPAPGEPPAGPPPADTPPAPAAEAQPSAAQATGRDAGSVLPAMLSASDLADRLGLNRERVESALRRFRGSHADCCLKVSGRRKNQPGYLYHTAQVLPVLQRMTKA